jgi:hypothetical protein
MLAGKWISKMFDPNDKQIVIKHERLSYEFTCDLDYKQFISIIDSYFKSLSKNVNFINYDYGRVRLK